MGGEAMGRASPSLFVGEAWITRLLTALNLRQRTPLQGTLSVLVSMVIAIALKSDHGCAITLNAVRSPTRRCCVKRWRISPLN